MLASTTSLLSFYHCQLREVVKAKVCLATIIT
jgi:hypothetical protein